jgi:hypothetical protein
MLCFALASCAGTPSVKEEPAVDEPSPMTSDENIQAAPVLPEAPADAESFDPATIPKEVFDSTKSDVQTLIEEINGIIRDKDFNAWVSYLGQDYREALSDEAFLKHVSESNVLKKQKITLRTLGDYFMHVVVPSRTKDRVDDIEFIGQNRVKAFTVNSKGQKLRLYDLEKTASGWKIVN